MKLNFTSKIISRERFKKKNRNLYFLKCITNI